jgi:hypothetical protein
VETATSLFEAIRKRVHLAPDQLALGKLGAAAAGAVQIPLDLIDNLLGNAAEMASPRPPARRRPGPCQSRSPPASWPSPA